MLCNVQCLAADVKGFCQAQVHKHTHTWREVQQCTLLSIKTGGCSEDCSYCPQSSRYNTGVQAQKLLSEDVVLEAAKKVRLILTLSTTNCMQTHFACRRPSVQQALRSCTKACRPSKSTCP